MKNLNEMLNEALSNINEAIDNNIYKKATDYAKKFTDDNEFGVLHSLWSNHVDNDMDLEETLEEMNWGESDDEKAFATVFLDLVDKYPDWYMEGDSDSIVKNLKKARKVVKSASAVRDEEYDDMIAVSVINSMSSVEKKFVEALMSVVE